MNLQGSVWNGERRQSTCDITSRRPDTSHGFPQINIVIYAVKRYLKWAIFKWEEIHPGAMWNKCISCGGNVFFWRHLEGFSVAFFSASFGTNKALKLAFEQVLRYVSVLRRGRLPSSASAITPSSKKGVHTQTTSTNGAHPEQIPPLMNQSEPCSVSCICLCMKSLETSLYFYTEMIKERKLIAKALLYAFPEKEKVILWDVDTNIKPPRSARTASTPLGTDSVKWRFATSFF